MVITLMNRSKIADNATRLLGELAQPVVTRYQLGLCVFQAIGTLPDLNPLETYTQCAQDILQRGVLRPIAGLRPSNAFSLIGTNAQDPRVLACGIDPFCYVSHLSAMEFHGLTNRMPEILYLSTPAPKDWKVFALERMKHDLGDNVEAYRDAGLPAMQPTSLSKLLGKPVHRTASVHYGAYRVYPDQHLRVSTLGRTFLDMLRAPELCGGIHHVIECFQDHAKPYLRLIADELDQHGSAIDKVRAGFILECLCGLSDARIENWKTLAKRGGSRKLDPAEDYSENFSEPWCLSINVALPTE